MDIDHVQLVRKARRGDRKALDRLAELAKERLGVYVWRLTLQEDLTQEIVQESLLEMCRVLGKLKKADRFWPWLYGIATNKLHRHYRTERVRKRAAMAESTRAGGQRLPSAAAERHKGLENLVADELRQIVSSAMKRLKTRHKAVLVMRCYDGMSYADIAESMGCSEFGTRMLFMRAKRSLQRELSRNGFGAGSLLTALIVFGKMTAPNEAAAAQVSVGAATMKVGVLASLAGLATTKTGIVSLTAAGALAVGAATVTSGDKGLMPGGPGQSGQPTMLSPTARTTSQTEQYWYYFPEGPQGPVMIRAWSTGADGKARWHLLQNGQANYYFEDNIIHVNSHRAWAADMSVLKMPTDGAELSSFLAEVEGTTSDMEHISASGRGLLVVASRDRNGSGNRPWVIRHSNVLEETYFQGDWPSDARTIDGRDAMHRRGWTYFQVSGQLNGREVRGKGRIPFAYFASKRHSPWIELKVGGATAVDNGTCACIYNADAVSARYAGGQFFKGLARPWMGLHTIDAVRRDAAEKRLRFQTEHQPGGPTADVVVACPDLDIRYTIDLQADLIRRIEFVSGDTSAGYIEFSYLLDIPDDAGEFAVPQIAAAARPQQPDIGPLWLARLAQGSLTTP